MTHINSLRGWIHSQAACSTHDPRRRCKRHGRNHAIAGSFDYGDCPVGCVSDVDAVGKRIYIDCDRCTTYTDVGNDIARGSVEDGNLVGAGIGNVDAIAGWICGDRGEGARDCGD